MELGRLLSEYFHWANIDAQGLNELQLAPWDKRIWDDEDSWFKAPSLRSVGNIAGTIAVAIASAVMTVASFGSAGPVAAVVLMALVMGTISATDELVFGALDVGFGYKTFIEFLTQRA